MAELMIKRDPSANTSEESPELLGIDYVEMYVGNALQAAHFYGTAFGLEPTMFAGPETGLPDRTSYLVANGTIRLVLTSPTSPDSEISEHITRHGDSVKDIAIRVRDARREFRVAVRRGGAAVAEPEAFDQADGLVKGTVAGIGDTVHSMIERQSETSAFLPKFRPIQSGPRLARTNVNSIDHVAMSVPAGELDRWVSFYETVFGFRKSHEEVVATEYSGMNSKVVENESGTIKFPVVEPVPGVRKSQIEEFIKFHRGPGVQHLALSSDDILDTVRAMREQGIRFLRTPKSYYDALPARVGEIEESIEALMEAGILVDRDRSGYLLQVFTLPLQARPTFFVELIQRKMARGFGAGNIKALFQAIEREQILRGNA